MALQPLALFLVAAGFSPNVDFLLGKTRCLKMCRKGCSDDSNVAASSCVTIAEEAGAPWVDPFTNGDQDMFKFKWCRAKYEISIVATQSHGGFFQAIKYPATGLESGEFAEVDHLDWIAPSCNKTTAPSCSTVESAQNLDNGLEEWLAFEGEECRHLANARACMGNCFKECDAWCECGWGESAAEVYRNGTMQRYRREAAGMKRDCHLAHTFMKVCICSNGIAADGDACLFHGAEQCVECAAGYTLTTERNGGRCQANACVCDHGAPVSSAECFVHGATKCSRDGCNAQFHFEEDDCKANVCVCDHGRPVGSAECLVHGATKCSRDGCNAHFHFEDDDCKANACVCDHGTPVGSAECLVHGATKCSRDGCNAQFHFEEDDCKANVCVCDHGRPVGSAECLVHGATKCSRDGCNAQFHFEEDDCKANVCACDHGRPVGSAECLVHGTTRCSRDGCNAQFHFDEDDCLANVCVCDHGTPVDSAECVVHRATKCSRDGCNAKFVSREDDCNINCDDSNLGDVCVSCAGSANIGCVASGQGGTCSNINGEWNCLVGCEGANLSNVCAACVGFANVGCVASGQRGTCSNNGSEWRCRGVDCQDSMLGDVCVACVGFANVACEASGRWGTCSKIYEEWKCLGVMLLGGTSASKGNVYFNGLPICDDAEWNGDAARVVCRMLGFPSGIHFAGSKFGNVGDVFSMDNVQCRGNETNIEDCDYSSVDNCFGSEGAGVECLASCASATMHTCTTPWVFDESKNNHVCASALCTDAECCAVVCDGSSLGSACAACVGHATTGCVASGQRGTCSNRSGEWNCLNNSK